MGKSIIIPGADFSQYSVGKAKPSPTLIWDTPCCWDNSGVLNQGSNFNSFAACRKVDINNFEGLIASIPEGYEIRVVAWNSTTGARTTSVYSGNVNVYNIAKSLLQDATKAAMNIFIEGATVGAGKPVIDLTQSADKIKWTIVY